MYTQQTISGQPIQYYKMNNLHYFVHTAMDGMTIEYVQYPIQGKPDFQMYSYNLPNSDLPLVFSNYPVPGVNAMELSSLQQMGMVPGTNFGTSLPLGQVSSTSTSDASKTTPISSVVDTLSSTLPKTLQEGFGIVDQIQSGIKDTIITPVQGAFTTAYNTAADFVKSIMGPIKAAARAIGSGIKCVIDNVLNLAKQIPKIPFAIRDVAISAFNGVKDVVVNTVGNFVTTVKTLGSKIYKIGGSLVKGVMKTASAIFKTISDGITVVVNTVKLIIDGITRLIKWLMTLPNKIADFAKKAWNTISGLASSMYSKIKNGILSIFNGDDDDNKVDEGSMSVTCKDDDDVCKEFQASEMMNRDINNIYLAVRSNATNLGNVILASLAPDTDSTRKALGNLIELTVAGTTDPTTLINTIQAAITAGATVDKTTYTADQVKQAVSLIGDLVKRNQTYLDIASKITSSLPSDKQDSILSKSLQFLVAAAVLGDSTLSQKAMDIASSINTKYKPADPAAVQTFSDNLTKLTDASKQGIINVASIVSASAASAASAASTSSTTSTSATTTTAAAEFFGFIDNKTWYKSWWFYFILFLVICAAVFFYMRRKRKL